MKYRNLLTPALSVALAFAAAPYAHASGNAVISISPASGNYSVGDTIPVSLYLNTGGANVTATKETIDLSSNLQYVSGNVNGAVLPAVVEPPTSDSGGSNDNSVQASYTYSGTAYNGTNGLLLNLVLKALSAGPATLTFDTSADDSAHNHAGEPATEVLDDGGNDITGTPVGASFTIAAAGTSSISTISSATATPTATAKATTLPVTGTPPYVPVAIFFLVIASVGLAIRSKRA